MICWRMAPSVKAHDPAPMPRAKKIFAGRNMTFSETMNDAVEDAQAIVIVTRWGAVQSFAAARREA
jgi:UDP-glucose 6-dehydrogenase